MSNTAIKLKKSGIAGNTPLDLNFGELALNYADGRLYYKNADGNIVYYQSGGGGGSSDSFATINVNSTLVFATSPTDTLSLVSGPGINIDSNTSSKTITISSPGFSTSDIKVDDFVGDGTTSTFTLSVQPSSASSVFVNVGGVFQLKNAYTVIGNQIIFNETPSLGEVIEVNTIYNSGTGPTNNDAYNQANLAFNKANASTILAQAAFDKANTGVTNSTDQFARDTANSGYSLAQASFDYANTIVSDIQTDQWARDEANTKVSKLGDTMIGALNVPDINVSNNIVTTDAQVKGNLQISNSLYFSDTVSSNVFQLQYNALTNSLDFIFP